MTLSAGAAQPVRVRAPGKVNIVLRVGSLQDDGYHDQEDGDYQGSDQDGRQTTEVRGGAHLLRRPLLLCFQ